MWVMLVLLGALLVGLTWKQAWRQALDKEKNKNYLECVVNLDERVSLLETKVSQSAALSKGATVPVRENREEQVEDKLELLLKGIEGLEQEIKNINQSTENKSEENDADIDDKVKNNQEKEDFSEYIDVADHEAVFNDIREAHASGKTITEIAQELGKGKGEVELILNLQKQRK